MIRTSVYIAEDERLAREALVDMFAALPHWRIAGAAENGKIALDACMACAPDVLVTDIRMPLLNGLELAGAVRAARPATQMVFVTAYDEHAVAAFRLAAVDYLLKPVTDAGFAACLARVEEVLRRARLAQELETAGVSLEQLLQRQRHTLRHLVVRSLGRVDIVPLPDVVLLRADGNYVNVVTAQRTWLHRETLKSLSGRLDPARFLQVHRSVIVAIAHVRGIERSGTATQLRLADGTLTPLASRYLPDVERALGM
jgi:two-component system, LytTR family, response regulator